MMTFRYMGVSFMVLPPKHLKMIILVGKPMVVGYHHFRKPPYDSDVEFDFHSPARCGDMLLPTTSREIELPKVATGLGTVENMPTTTIRYRPITMGLLTETDIHMVSFSLLYIYIYIHQHTRSVYHSWHVSQGRQLKALVCYVFFEVE